MKYIQKNPEPKELKQWREDQLAQGVNFTYENFKNPEKRITRQSLLQEQGWICCYCCQRITLEISHIEHFDPQSKSDPILTVTYSNMLASCGPLERDPADRQKSVKWPEHCGHQRGRDHKHNNETICKNAALPIAPQHDPQCETYFTYRSNGEIQAVKDHPRAADAQQMIKILNLNDPDLIKARQLILRTLQGLTDAEAQILWQRNQNRNQQGEFRSFCPAALDYLRQNFNLP